MATNSTFEHQVFINCPFDDEYLPLLRPLLFTVQFLGFTPRIASERLDSGENRIDKICALIHDCRFSIHDLSRLRATKVGEYFRMNMPFELGIDYGLRQFGEGKFASKRFLILEKERYEFQKALSDLSGVDIKGHRNEPDEVVRAVRDWFVEVGSLMNVASPTVVWYRFTDFTSDFYDARFEEGFTDADLNMMPVPEYIRFIGKWISEDKDY
jgi:hypothetical protein